MYAVAILAGIFAVLRAFDPCTATSLTMLLVADLLLLRWAWAATSAPMPEASGDEPAPLAVEPGPSDHRPQRARLARRLLHPATLMAAWACALTAFVAWRAWFPGQPLDPVAWQADAEARTGVRLPMADRLLASDALIGKTRPEVVAWLGEPPRTGYFADWDLVYRLGIERGLFPIDSEWLVLRLDARGRVAEARIVTD